MDIRLKLMLQGIVVGAVILLWASVLLIPHWGTIINGILATMLVLMYIQTAGDLVELEEMNQRMDRLDNLTKKERIDDLK